MTEQVDHGFEKQMVARLLASTQQVLDMVATCHDAGLVDDVEAVLGAELHQRGISDLSQEWLARTADLIRLGERPVMPSADDLWDDAITEPGHQ